ncbi:hypothetical protein [Streptomyces sp. NPDC096032]
MPDRAHQHGCHPDRVNRSHATEPTQGVTAARRTQKPVLQQA